MYFHRLLHKNTVKLYYTINWFLNISFLFNLAHKHEDIPAPTIDYEKLKMLCGIEGLKGR